MTHNLSFATTGSPSRATLWLVLLLVLVVVLGLCSLNVGASRMNLLNVFGADPDDRVSKLLFVSRLPRTLALILAGAALAVAGAILQMMARNRLLDTSTTGPMEAAALGMLVLAILLPEGLPLWARFLVVSSFAAGGILLFLGVLKRMPLRSALIVPLVGLVIAAVVHTGSSLLAHHFDLAQSLRAWGSGDFSAVLRGRYELLWIAAALTIAAMLLADRFTVIGMGRDFATNVGVNYTRLLAAGVLLVSLIVGSVVVTAGVIPFIGLVAPNLVRLITGDNLRRAIPLIALMGAAVLLSADLLGRLLIHPYEVPSSNILSIAGCLIFLVILLHGRSRWA
ncbi:iron chelate uptake ABC transporter family permease subunit [Pseudomonas sp. gcc21]|uniref:iron chelate uptake ABC transporter family permease subunit n=1 Tax=Pseudomonas sp. gcc21 TaxID=2726989 RepID=UPI0014528D04|nr:iron chelate uptake ABC transporter family permease subunit [Pseudomonas sp. gcc21]QJD59391.1 iron chelate uptake ABC transporter family permease subunit [Pseudomonas sp. gcc21]